MVSRALSLATVMLLIGCLAAIPARAQNLEAGKSPSQIFAGTCNACHKAPRGLLKTVPAGSLPGFLRQHYTTSSEMAALLAGFLISNGATDNRVLGSKPTQQPKDAKPAGPEQLDRFGRPVRPAPTQEAAKPDVDGLGEAGRPGRNAKRLGRPGEAPDAAKPAADGQAPAQAAVAPGPDDRRPSAKQKLSKRGRPGGEEPAKDEPAKSEAGKEDTPKGEAAKETAKETGRETPRDEATRPAAEGKSETARVDGPKESVTPELRPDPVPPVTPAPAVSAAVSSGGSEPPASAAPQPAAPSAPPPSATAFAPTLPPVAPAGPPAPPISQ